jgi:N-acetylglucosamine-6-phosphate deacetylase
MSATYIDLQVNGHGGIDLLTARNSDDVRTVSKSLYKNGVLGYLPTLITSPLADTIKALKLIEEVRKDPQPDEALILGTHLEGPFISPEKCGVHPREHMALPNQGYVDSLIETGLIKIVTIAPELPGALSLIKYLTERGIVVSLGHSNANRSEAEAGFDAGAKTVTHLFNAMRKPPLDGLTQVAIDRSDVMIQIIVDGVHVPNEVVKKTLEKVSNRFILTNDAIAAAGLGTGTYPFGDMTITIENSEARRIDGTLAGGIGTLGRSLEILKKLQISESDALASVTTRPCSLLNLDYKMLVT